MMMGPMMGFGGITMLVWFLVALAIVSLFVYGVIHYTSREAKVARHGGSGDPLRILDERYARGEIDSETYHRMKADLR
ncbi:MAG: SHOCT domain-containing protein [Alicyclobacillus sp.]|nr:SHOCT domain-containing protein [Alicyclobacillus sp.]